MRWCGGRWRAVGCDAIRSQSVPFASVLPVCVRVHFAAFSTLSATNLAKGTTKGERTEASLLRQVTTPQEPQGHRHKSNPAVTTSIKCSMHPPTVQRHVRNVAAGPMKLAPSGSSLTCLRCHLGRPREDEVVDHSEDRIVQHQIRHRNETEACPSHNRYPLEKNHRSKEASDHHCRETS